MFGKFLDGDSIEGQSPKKLTGAKRGEFSGRIPVITSNVIIPATPSNPSIPYVKRTSKKNKPPFSSRHWRLRVGPPNVLVLPALGIKGAVLQVPARMRCRGSRQVIPHDTTRIVFA